MSNILSPIILSKNGNKNITNQKIFLQGHLSNDIFDIYTVVNNTNRKYCHTLVNYLCPDNRNSLEETHEYNQRNPYYKCPANNNVSNILNNNKYLIIEFKNSTSFILLGNTKYIVKKITFNVPAYHYVSNESNPDPNICCKRGIVNSETNNIENCMEIEIMCIDSLTQKKLILSTLCITDTKDGSSNINIDHFNSKSTKSFVVINNYISGDKASQLSGGGFRNSKYIFNCNDFLPEKKHFFQYKGSTFKTDGTTKIDSSHSGVNIVNRIVFEDYLIIPNIFYENIKTLTVNDNCNSNNIPINKFINLTEKHELKYSDTNIDFVSKNINVVKKKNTKIMLYLILFLFVLILLIMFFIALKEGVIKNALREIFRDNQVIYSFIIRYM